MLPDEIFFVILRLSLLGVAFGLRPSTPPNRDRTRQVNPIQTYSQHNTVNIQNRVNHFQERSIFG